MDEHYGTDPMLECECFLHRRIRELEARLKNHETYCPGLLARGARAEADVKRLKDERESADHSGCRAREEDLEAEVERLRFALSEHGCDWYGDRHGSRFKGGGRESGERVYPESASPVTQAGNGEGIHSPPAAAYPAARKEAGR